jgi:hypothetical protein
MRVIEAAIRLLGVGVGQGRTGQGVRVRVTQHLLALGGSGLQQGDSVRLTPLSAQVLYCGLVCVSGLG